MERINNIALDYEKGELKINGRRIIAPVKVVVKEEDEWDIVKLFNPEKAKREMIYPEIVIDARVFIENLRKQELKEIMREVIREENLSRQNR